MHINFERESSIESYYEQASRMDIVGVACKSFLKNLCPTYMDDWPMPGRGSLEARLTRLQSTKVFPALKNGLRVEVNIVNPYCDFANERAREERQFNPGCREDLHRGVAALECLADDIANAGETRELWIDGKVEVWLMRCNPYISSTRISFNNDRPDLLRVGFLLFERMGTQGPAIHLEQEAQEIWEAFQIHMGSLSGKRDFLFSWRGNRGEFRKEFPKPGGHNVFFSYNREDVGQVTHFGEELYRRGLIYWQDTRSIWPGQEWAAAIQRAIAKCPAALIFFGPRGLGYWQVREIDLLLNRASEDREFKIIPTVLPGGAIPGDLMGRLARFNAISARDAHSARHFAEVAQAVRDANGFG